jgi:hypothetical protein
MDPRMKIDVYGLDVMVIVQWLHKKTAPNSVVYCSILIHFLGGKYSNGAKVNDRESVGNA